MAKHGLTVAKAKKSEFKLVWDFVNAMEALFDSRGVFNQPWWEWPKDDKEYKELRKIQKELDCSKDDDAILFEFIKRKFQKANYSGSFGRILLDCETLIDNCCDPKLDYLEFKPSIMYAERDALAKVEKIITKGEKKKQSSDKILEAIKKHIEESKKEDEE